MPSSQRMIRMMAIVSSICTLLAASRSNRCATVEAARAILPLALLFLLLSVSSAAAQALDTTADVQPHDSQQAKGASIGPFLAGALAGLAAHEGGHLVFNLAFDARPRLKRVDFHGLPFFAIAHRPDLSRRREMAASSAGLWVQHAGSEWILTSRPRLREQRAPVLKGIVAFNVLTSAAYAGAAFARTGPPERDTRGIAVSARVDERWVGAMVLGPAVLDVWRYFHPDAKWATWTSRAAKIGMMLLAIR